MKILLINSEFPPLGGGAGNASANLARQLVTRGHEVVVLTARHARLPHEELWQGVRLLRIPCLRRRVDRSGAFEQLTFILGGSLWVRRLLKSFQAQVVLAFFGVPGGVIAWLVNKSHHIPYLVSLRGGDVPGFRPYDFGTYHRLVAPLLHRVWRDAGGLVANSQGLRSLALQFEPDAHIELIPNGVDLATFYTVDRAWSPARLLSVGRVVHQKGLDLALHALAELKDLEWDWVIAGDGPKRVELEAMADHLGLASRVRWAGWQSRQELLSLYHQANLFVFPSRHEGMPNALLEAMACGLPVIASQIAGNEELVVPGKTGGLFPAESVESLREALRWMIPDAQLRRDMGSAGHLRVETQYTWESTAEGYDRLLTAMQGRP